MSIRNYTTLTVGDVIPFTYNDKLHQIAIIQVQPDDGRRVINVVETDLQVDFCPPVGYQEPGPPAARSIAGSLDTTSPSTSSQFTPFSGSANRLYGRAAPREEKKGDELQILNVPDNTLLFLRRPAAKADKTQ